MNLEDLDPETQEKLLQFQKYQEEKLRDPKQQMEESTAIRKRRFEHDYPAKSEPPNKVSINNTG